MTNIMKTEKSLSLTKDKREDKREELIALQREDEMEGVVHWSVYEIFGFRNSSVRLNAPWYPVGLYLWIYVLSE